MKCPTEKWALAVQRHYQLMTEQAVAGCNVDHGKGHLQKQTSYIKLKQGCGRRNKYPIAFEPFNDRILPSSTAYIFQAVCASIHCFYLFGSIILLCVKEVTTPSLSQSNSNLIPTAITIAVIC